MFKKSVVLCLLTAFMLLTAVPLSGSAIAGEAENPWFEVQIVDKTTGKGIPNTLLVRNGLIRFVTDSLGRVAIMEPDLMNQKVYFDVENDGYKTASNNALSPGIVLNIVPGGKVVIKLERTAIAEPAYRITGSGIYKDSGILGLKAPVDDPFSCGGVLNKDVIFTGRNVNSKASVSAQTVEYKGKLYWFHNGLRGAAFSQRNNKMALAISDLPGKNGGDTDKGVNLAYVLGDDGFPKEMAPFGSEKDIVWFDSVMVVKDSKGVDKLAAHYIIIDSKSEKKEHGIAVYNDSKKVFEKLAVMDIKEEWRFPTGRNFIQNENNIDYLYFGNVFPTVRVPATLDALKDPSKYEAWTCYESGMTTAVLRNKKGELVYRWSKQTKPVGFDEEKSLIRKKLINESEAMFQIKDGTGKVISFQAGSIQYNPYRKKWIMIGTEMNGNPSRYGEVWYSEAFRPTGPWKKAVKIFSHNNYSYLNPLYHNAFDQDGGRVIYFDGTYTTELSGNTMPRLMYDNNQLMYRLQLDDNRITSAFAGMTDNIPPGPDPSYETPSGETPSDETPSDETPSDETPSDETPSDETPSGETPSDKTPGEEPSDGDNIPNTGSDINNIVFWMASISLLILGIFALMKWRAHNAKYGN